MTFPTTVYTNICLNVNKYTRGKRTRNLRALATLSVYLSRQDNYVNNGINRTTVLAGITESRTATEGVWPICCQINDKPLLFV